MSVAATSRRTARDRSEQLRPGRAVLREQRTELVTTRVEEFTQGGRLRHRSDVRHSPRIPRLHPLGDYTLNRNSTEFRYIQPSGVRGRSSRPGLPRVVAAEQTVPFAMRARLCALG